MFHRFAPPPPEGSTPAPRFRVRSDLQSPSPPHQTPATPASPPFSIPILPPTPAALRPSHFPRSPDAFDSSHSSSLQTAAPSFRRRFFPTGFSPTFPRPPEPRASLASSPHYSSRTSRFSSAKSSHSRRSRRDRSTPADTYPDSPFRGPSDTARKHSHWNPRTRAAHSTRTRRLTR